MSERRLFADGLLGRLLLPEARDRDGLDERVVRLVRPLVERSLRLWFRLEVYGFERAPRGAALLVGNHNAGITFLEPFGMAAFWYRERGGGRALVPPRPRRGPAQRDDAALPSPVSMSANGAGLEP